MPNLRSSRWFFVIKASTSDGTCPQRWSDQAKYLTWVPINNGADIYGYVQFTRSFKPSQTLRFVNQGEVIAFVQAKLNDFQRQKHTFLDNPLTQFRCQYDLHNIDDREILKELFDLL